MKRTVTTISAVCMIMDNGKTDQKVLTFQADTLQKFDDALKHYAKAKQIQSMRISEKGVISSALWVIDDATFFKYAKQHGDPEKMAIDYSANLTELPENLKK